MTLGMTYPNGGQKPGDMHPLLQTQLGYSLTHLLWGHGGATCEDTG